MTDQEKRIEERKQSFETMMFSAFLHGTDTDEGFKIWFDRNSLSNQFEYLINQELSSLRSELAEKQSEFDLFKKNTAFREELSIENLNKRDIKIEELENRLAEKEKELSEQRFENNMVLSRESEI